MSKKKGKGGLMAVKVDLEKAYDKVCWDFIIDTLKEVGFQLIMNQTYFSYS